jgi:hypothetical protein
MFNRSRRMSAVGRGCVKTSARFRTSLFRLLLEALERSESKKSRKILLCSIVYKISPSFYTASIEGGPLPSEQRSSQKGGKRAYGIAARRTGVHEIADIHIEREIAFTALSRHSGSVHNG